MVNCSDRLPFYNFTIFNEIITLSIIDENQFCNFNNFINRATGLRIIPKICTKLLNRPTLFHQPTYAFLRVLGMHTTILSSSKDFRCLIESCIISPLTDKTNLRNGAVNVVKTSIKLLNRATSV